MNNEIWKDFLKGHIGITCNTYEEAIILMDYLRYKGIKWSSGDIATTEYKNGIGNWNMFKEDTCYSIGNCGLRYSSVEFAEKKMEVIYFMNVMKGEFV